VGENRRKEGQALLGAFKHVAGESDGALAATVPPLSSAPLRPRRGQIGAHLGGGRMLELRLCPV
jgi:hypothetical protein